MSIIKDSFIKRSLLLLSAWHMLRGSGISSRVWASLECVLRLVVLKLPSKLAWRVTSHCGIKPWLRLLGFALRSGTARRSVCLDLLALLQDGWPCHIAVKAGISYSQGFRFWKGVKLTLILHTVRRDAVLVQVLIWTGWSFSWRTWGSDLTIFVRTRWSALDRCVGCHRCCLLHCFISDGSAGFVRGCDSNQETIN